MTVLMKNSSPCSFQSMPQELVPPWQTTSKSLRVGWYRQIAAVQRDPLVAGRPRRSDARRGLDAVAAVEPAVRPPLQAVGDVVPHGVGVPAVENHLGLAVGHVVAVAIGQEQEPGRAKRPDAAEADLDAGQPRALVPEHLVPVGAAVVVGVFEDDDPVALRQVEVQGPLGIGVILGHPEPAPRIGRERDRLPHVGLRREQRHLEPLRRREARRRLLRRGQRDRLGLRVLRRGGLGRVQPAVRRGQYQEQSEIIAWRIKDRRIIMVFLASTRGPLPGRSGRTGFADGMSVIPQGSTLSVACAHRNRALRTRRTRVDRRYRLLAVMYVASARMFSLNVAEAMMPSAGVTLRSCRSRTEPGSVQAPRWSRLAMIFWTLAVSSGVSCSGSSSPRQVGRRAGGDSRPRWYPGASRRRIRNASVRGRRRRSVDNRG